MNKININITKPSPELEKWLEEFAKAEIDDNENVITEGDIERLTRERIKIDRNRDL